MAASIHLRRIRCEDARRLIVLFRRKRERELGKNGASSLARHETLKTLATDFISDARPEMIFANDKNAEESYLVKGRRRISRWRGISEAYEQLAARQLHNQQMISRMIMRNEWRTRPWRVVPLPNWFGEDARFLPRLFAVERREIKVRFCLGGESNVVARSNSLFTLLP